MYQITVERDFCAAHALLIAGTREPIHGHNFRVTATISGERLDDDGLLCDFHTVNAVLKDICRPLVNADLNRVEVILENPTIVLTSRMSYHLAIVAGNLEVRVRNHDATAAGGTGANVTMTVKIRYHFPST